MSFEDLLLKTLKLIKDSDVPLDQKSLVSMIDCGEDNEILTNVFKYIEDERLADYFLRGYVLSPLGRDYLKRSKMFSGKQARLDFLGD